MTKKDLDTVLIIKDLGYREEGPGQTVIHTKQVINGLNLPAEPGQGVEMGKRVRKTHSKVKKIKL